MNGVDTLRARIRDVPDFPKPGILFRDITPLLSDPAMLELSLDHLERWAKPRKPDVICGMESRGFMFGVPLADRLGCGFIPVRKHGKLPADTVAQTYALEYGTDTLEIHSDAVSSGQRVLIVDDLLATGGTAAATVALLGKLEAEVVGALFLIELSFLDGRNRMKDIDTHSVIVY